MCAFQTHEGIIGDELDVSEGSVDQKSHFGNLLRDLH